MSYATVMVHLDIEQSNDARLAAAAAVAQRFDAAVIGVAAADPHPSVYFYGSYGEKLVEQDREKVRRRLHDLEERFRGAMSGRAPKLEWRSALAQPVPYVARQARAADLIVVGASRARGLADPMRELDPADLVMQAGRPLLVVPPEPEELRADRIVVAWKDTREARRAVRDALPLLRRCGQAIVAAIEEEDAPPHFGEAVDDVVAWLERHGVAAHGKVMPPFDDTADQLDAIAREYGADLIVAGAYGHSRLTEWVLGGVTRDLLKKTARCSFLAH